MTREAVMWGKGEGVRLTEGPHCSLIRSTEISETEWDSGLVAAENRRRHAQGSLGITEYKDVYHLRRDANFKEFLCKK